MTELRRITPLVMARVSQEPLTYCRTSLAPAVESSRATVNKAVNMLAWRRWVRESDLPHEPGEPARTTLLEATPKFAEDVSNIAVALTLRLGNKHAGMYAEALASCSLAGQETDSAARTALSAAYLGRAVLLGEQVGLEEFGWYDGLSGWRALIETQTHLANAGQLEPVGAVALAAT